MIVSNSRKIIYLRVPRTGSTSLSNFLVDHLPLSRDVDFHTPLPYNNVAGLNFSAAESVHANLADILGYGILRHPLEEYLVFAVVRDPVDRFLSSAWHACRHLGLAVETNDQAVTYAWQAASPDATIFRPQAHWLVHQGRPINRIFPYGHIDKMAQVILGSEQAKVTYRHRSETRTSRNSELDLSLRNRILALYADDQRLYESALAQHR